MRFWVFCLLIDSKCATSYTNSGARTGTNLKVVALAHVWREAPEKKFFLSCRSTVLALQVQLIVLMSAFVIVSTGWSVSCLSTRSAPRAQPFVKVGVRVHVPYGVGATVHECLCCSLCICRDLVSWHSPIAPTPNELVRKWVERSSRAAKSRQVNTLFLQKMQSSTSSKWV